MTTETTIAADAAKVETLAASALAPVTTDLKTLLATRAGDLLIALIALGGVLMGHIL